MKLAKHIIYSLIDYKLLFYFFFFQIISNYTLVYTSDAFDLDPCQRKIYIYIVL